MDKMKLAHDMALAMAADGNVPNENIIAIVWQYADAMQAEAEKRNKAEAEQKRKEIREMLNAPNTFVEREGQHFDDVNWQPDWSQAPEWAKWWYVTNKNNHKWCSKKPYQDGCNWFVGGNETYSLCNAPSFGYQGSWQDSLRKRPQ